MGLREQLGAMVREALGPGPLVGPAVGAATNGQPAAAEQRSVWLDAEWWGIDPGKVPVTESSALTYSAFFAAVRLLSSVAGMLPLNMYRRRPDGGKDLADDHPLYEVLHTLPNPTMPSFQWRETGTSHLLTWGNAYNQILTDGAGRVRELWPLGPDKMETRWQDGSLTYRYDNQLIPAGQVLHIPGMGFDGRVGYSVVGLARRAIGMGISLEVSGKDFIDNGSNPGGVLQHPASLKDQAYKRLLASWEARHKGPKNAGKVAILEEGMTYSPVGIPPRDAEFLESRKFQVSEIARWFGLPPHMLADLDRATFSNIEEQSLEFVIYALQPLLTRWESWLTIRLLTPSERRSGLFLEFKLQGLLRGDIKSRYEAYAIGRQNGWLSANDIRSLENMNPIENGDAYLVPLNMVEAGSEPAAADGQRDLLIFDENAPTLALPQRGREERARGLAGNRLRLAERQRRVFLDVMERVLRRERNDVLAQARKMLGKTPVQHFEAWLAEFYERHAEWSAEQALPLMLAYAELVADYVGEELEREGLAGQVENFTRQYAADFGTRNARRNQASLLEMLRSLIEPEEQLTALEERFEGWMETKPQALAHEESVQENNAVSVALYSLVGVERIRSVATGESSCPYCRALDGKVIGIREFFLTVGEVFNPEGAEKPLTVSGNKRHAPYHGGCDCMVVAG